MNKRSGLVRFWSADGQGGGEFLWVTPAEAERLANDPDEQRALELNGDACDSEGRWS